MKKILIILAACLVSAGSARAQLWDELFNQKKTQTRYLLEQIAALKVYIGHVQKTYVIAKDGLDFISKATKGELDLHDAFFTSLGQVNPQVRNYPKAKDILLLHRATISAEKQYRGALAGKGRLTANELAYIERIFGEILKDCDALSGELEAVLAPGGLQMSDDERIERINDLYGQMQSNFQVMESFGIAAVQLAILREREKMEMENSGRYLQKK
ncbi:hypothetical protein [Pedobacter chitinilyticus]|uniref:TerB family tellurite resistance protein n=1 Tax=Pedobacter chitinilyticus TaxID=2233776 RepID=A0A3S3SS65_9SPHI|nr:hypothetical protein [Pedobacter chitinilyticus]RWU08131.1 hypothetical protein DPV69_07055 [Pedobacter chitinilyticus]